MPDQATTEGAIMSKGEKRGNREAKKPKQAKPEALAPVSPFAAPGKASTASTKGARPKR
jgi:hypothetical protein